MRAADVMTPDPVCISPDASITDAIRLMLERKFSGLPVVDARGALVGIVTEGDLVRRTETGTQRKRWGWIEFLMGPGRLAAEYLQTAGRKVGDVMTADVRTVTEDSRLDEIVHLMERHQINRVLVVRDGKLVGIVTRANLLHALASVIAEAKPGLTSDASIREQIYAELKAQRWAPVGLIKSWSATGSCTFQAGWSMSGSAGRSARPRKTSPELRPSKTILSGSTRCPGSQSTRLKKRLSANRRLLDAG